MAAYRRNLLVVLAHGLRSDAVGPASVWPVGTPNLEQLCGRGLRLVASSASPANWGGQVSLLTGLQARQHGYLKESPAPPTFKGVPALLRESGYHVAGVGCIGAFQASLDQAVVVHPATMTDPRRCAYLEYAAAKGLKTALIQQRRQRERYGPFEPDRIALEPDDDIDGFIGVQACAMIEKLPEDKPWALFVAFSGPGNELPPPPLYADVTSPGDVQDDFVPANFRELDALAELDYPRVMLQRLRPAQIGRIRADYLGRVSLVDFCVGQMMRDITARGDGGQTWFVMSSDHGHLLGEHGLVGHRSFLAPSVEVPAFIVPPQGAAEEAVDWLCSTVDVAATIAGLAVSALVIAWPPSDVLGVSSQVSWPTRATTNAPPPS